MRNLKGLKTISIWDVHPRESGTKEPPEELSCVSQPQQLLNSGLTGALANTMVFSQRQSQATNYVGLSIFQRHRLT